jgi:hypothetical protein
MKRIAIILAIMISCLYEEMRSSDIPVQGMTIGLHAGDRGQSIEAMYSYGSLVYWPKTTFVKGLGTISAGIETGPLNSDQFIIAPKINYTMNWFVSFGASMLYYTNFSEGSLRFRPEVGISMLGVRLYHGWNFSVDRYNPLPMNSSFFGLSYFVKF